jgi:hypothetical protein
MLPLPSSISSILVRRPSDPSLFRFSTDWIQTPSLWIQAKAEQALQNLGLIEKRVPESSIARLVSALTTTLGGSLFQLQQSAPEILASLTLALLFAVLLMSWSSRFGGFGRFSPFARSPNSSSDNPQVTDQDFSYITPEDLARSDAEQKSHLSSDTSGGSRDSNRPSRDTDAIVVKHRGVSYPIHFPAYSIDDGELHIGSLRTAAARKLDVPLNDASRIKLFYRGRSLKDDAKRARDEGLRSDSTAEILAVVGDRMAKPESDDEDEVEVEEDVDLGDGTKKKKKRRQRTKKKTKRGETSGTATPTSTVSSASGLNPDATYAPSTAAPPKPSAPQPSKAPQTALEKLDALATNFHTTLVPQCIQYISNPPTDPAKKTFDHKRLTETILTQVILKLDAVETEGNPEARQRRKDLVKETQQMLNRLDAVVKA